MVYSFARIGAAIGMRVEDVYTQNRRLWVRLHEKGGKQHAMPCHHNLESYLARVYRRRGARERSEGAVCSKATAAATGATRRQSPAPGERLCDDPEAARGPADITTKIGNHTFRATGVTAYLKNGGTLEKAAAMANHASTRTTQLYDRRSDEVTLDEVERVAI